MFRHEWSEIIWECGDLLHWEGCVNDIPYDNTQLSNSTSWHCCCINSWYREHLSRLRHGNDMSVYFYGIMMTHCVTLNFDQTHDIELGFSNSDKDRHGTKGSWFERTLDPPETIWAMSFSMGFQGLVLIKTVDKNCIPGMGWLIVIERKECEPIGSRTHFVTLNFDLAHDLDLGFPRSNFEKKTNKPQNPQKNPVCQEWDHSSYNRHILSILASKSR